VETFFQQNETVIVFAHGLVLFALGFAAWLQRRRATRLTLTSSLIWLASFAFLEALVIWGFVFIPIQSTYLAPEVIQTLELVRAVLQTIAVLFLLQFGLRLVPWTRRHLAAFSVASIVGWVAIIVGVTIAAGEAGWGVLQWEATTAQFSRYVFVVPGALLSAYGMWLQRDQLTRVGMKGIRPYAALAAAALLVYALVGGAIVAQAPWAPIGVGNESGWFAITGFPLAVIRGLVALALLLAVIKLLDIFEVEAKQHIENLDRARLVAEERARFGRDLHDGTIQSIYASGLHLEAVALNTTDAGTRDEIRRVVGSLNSTIDGLRRYIRGLQAPDGGPAGIASDLDRSVRDFADASHVEVTFRVTGQESCGALPEGAGQHLNHILRESLANVARHAGPCVVNVSLAFHPDEINLTISDTGGGIRDEVAGSAAPGHGNGLKNMHDRARWLGGRIVIESSPSGGTRVVLAVPLDDMASTEMPATQQGTPTEVMN